MPFLKHRSSASWAPSSPSELHLTRAEDRDAKIDDNPFAHFITPPSSPSLDGGDDDDEDEGESSGYWSSAGISPVDQQPHSRSPSPSPFRRRERSNVSPRESFKSSHSLQDLRRWVLQLPQPLIVPHTPQLQPQHLSLDDIPSFPSLKPVDGPLRRSSSEPCRGRQSLRAGSAGRESDRFRHANHSNRPRSWKEPGLGIWTVSEEREDETEASEPDGSKGETSQEIEEDDSSWMLRAETAWEHL